jgi:thymidine kinase
LKQKADYLISKTTNILELPIAKKLIHGILVDEVQFLEVEQINQLRLATTAWNIPIYCYGLRTDFRTELFPGSKRLLEVADVIEEIETTCHYCANKAVLNLKHVNGVADTKGPTVQLGAEEKYYPTCFHCYRREVASAQQSPVSEWNDDQLLKSYSESFHANPKKGIPIGYHPMEEKK